MRPPCLIIRILFLTKTNKTLAVTQGLRPLFLLRLPLAPKQAGAGEETALVPQVCITARKTLKTG